MSAMSGRLKALGPGLLFAAVSVGVSHLVWSTRAGATYGFTLVWVILLALFLKWPLFEFGQRYAVATGTSLLEGYRRQGKWTLVVYMILTLGTMFTVLGAVGAVTAGLAMELTGLTFGGGASGVHVWTAILLLCGGALLLVGRYPLLDKVIKVIMAILGVSALAATIMVIPKLGGITLFGPIDWTSAAAMVFVVGLVGWMPTGMDVCVWQSFWALARRRETGHTPSLKETLFDFRFGYVGTALLAVMFCVLGTAVMHGPGIIPEDSASRFAAQIVTLFTSSLGEWSRPIILIAAFTTMFSTTLTVMDGFPRALQLVVRRFRTPEDASEVSMSAARSAGYWVWMSVLGAGAMGIVLFVLAKQDDFKRLVVLASILSFITGPFLGILTYRAIMAEWVPDEFKPGPALRWLAIAGIVFLIAFLALFVLFA
jgi:Mn2+/Fe2+ NRAMP family transporter